MPLAREVSTPDLTPTPLPTPYTYPLYLPHIPTPGADPTIKDGYGLTPLERAHKVVRARIRVKVGIRVRVTVTVRVTVRVRGSYP